MFEGIPSCNKGHLGQAVIYFTSVKLLQGPPWPSQSGPCYCVKKLFTLITDDDEICYNTGNSRLCSNLLSGNALNDLYLQF